MVVANPYWGAPRIHGELLKLGIAISERTVRRPALRAPTLRKNPSFTAIAMQTLALTIVRERAAQQRRSSGPLKRTF
jgi:hypothetical protein